MMYKQLTSEQRYTISVLLQRKCSLIFIADTIGVSVSTVCRERKRNSNAKGVYDGHLAVLRTKRRKGKTPGNRSIPPYVRSRVFELIRKEQWSPEQVSCWLRREEGLTVSKSSIYNWIAGSSPHYKDSIHKHLRHGGKMAAKTAKGSRIPIPNRVSIDQRPSEANGRTFGDWEMDTIVGKDGKGAIVTLVERKSSFMLMEKLDTGRQAIPLADAVVRLLKGCRLPVRTITTDNGTEFAAHEKISSELKAKVYFTHPYCSWEKGTIENTNGLIRQYIPKKTDFRGITKGYVSMVVEKLNNRPRKKNGFIKPIDMIKGKIT
jgi:IS30 family transposase